MASSLREHAGDYWYVNRSNASNACEDQAYLKVIRDRVLPHTDTM